jgi:SAC3 family protein LENG8/THP3
MLLWHVDFTVDVYEFHGRVALESYDLNEYNQCQTQLKQMYTAGLHGSEMEFVAYRILYYVYLQGNQKYQQGNQDLAHLMAAIPPEAFV